MRIDNGAQATCLFSQGESNLKYFPAVPISAVAFVFPSVFVLTYYIAFVLIFAITFVLTFFHI